MTEKKNRRRVEFGDDVIRTYDVDGVPSETVERVHTIDGTYPRGILKTGAREPDKDSAGDEETEHADDMDVDDDQDVELTDERVVDSAVEMVPSVDRRIKVTRQPLHAPSVHPPPSSLINRTTDDLGNFDFGVGKYRIRWVPPSPDDDRLVEEVPESYDDVVKRRTWRVLTDLDDDDDDDRNRSFGSKNSLDSVLLAQSSGHRRSRPFNSTRYSQAANVTIPFASNGVRYADDDAYGRRRVDYPSRTSRYTDHELNEILRAIG